MSSSTAYQFLEKPASSLAILLLCIPASYILLSLGRLCLDPLRDIPGPLLARFTRFWELGQVRKGHFEKTHYELHKQYGPIVRIAPNKYSISDPQVIKKLYGHGTKFIKAPFYHAFGNPDYENADLFSERNIERHAVKRRKVANLYSMSTLLSYEAFVDKCNSDLLEHMDKFVSQGSVIDVPQWMQFYAFDVIGEITVGKSFGFMQKGEDFNGILGAIHESAVYGSRVGLFPEMHPIFASAARMSNQAVPFDKIANYINSSLESRKTGKASSDRNDFMTKLISLREAGKIDDLDVFTTMGANIVAGSDTTAISLSTVIYSLTKNPDKAQKLRQEISEFEKAGKLSNPVTFKESQTMPYLQAVIKEAIRIHPATGQPLGRIIPSEGAVLCDRFFPGGTEVGTSPWVIHFDEATFGKDAHSFSPERWLGDEDRVKAMDANLLSFGSGARTCAGKNISLLEMGKVIPQLYRKYEFLLDEPSREWDVDMVWFVKQQFNCKVRQL